MRPYRRAHHRMGRPSRLALMRRPAIAPDPRLPTSVATALQEMGILQAAGAPPGGSPDGWALKREVEEWSFRPVPLMLSLTCFLLLFGLIAWHPWR